MNQTSNKRRIERLKLDGLRIAPPQVWGGVRLVPLLRDAPREDLRLDRQLFDEEPVGALLNRRTAYYSYLPHAITATWTNDGSAVFGSQLSKGDKRKPDIPTSRMLRRLARREGKRSLRFVPLHLAMEGLLAYQFGGPSVAWSEYSRVANSRGLGSRSETVWPSCSIAGLSDAMRVFEIHEGQAGVLVFVADALASAFIVPHPDDYRVLHETLLTDFYGELLFYYSLYASENSFLPEPICDEEVNSIDDLRRELNSLRSRWGAMLEPMTKALFGVPIDAESVYQMGPFSMQRFMTDLDPKSENHIGEMIVDSEEEVQYFKSYRLSAAQCRRAFLLKCLAEHDWELEACAHQLNCKKKELILRMENAGFGYLLHQHVLDAAKAWERNSRR